MKPLSIIHIIMRTFHDDIDSLQELESKIFYWKKNNLEMLSSN